MGMYDRDWYRDWVREREGYTERADFRVSQAEYQRGKRRKEWLSFAWRVVSWGAAFFLIARVVVRLFLGTH